MLLLLRDPRGERSEQTRARRFTAAEVPQAESLAGPYPQSLVLSRSLSPSLFYLSIAALARAFLSLALYIYFVLSRSCAYALYGVLFRLRCTALECRPVATVNTYISRNGFSENRVYTCAGRYVCV